jgi:hypothetical protein
MRLVADISALRSASIQGYLGASTHNEVILPQTVLAECLKGDAPKNTRESLKGLAQFSRQIFVLKAGKTILGMRPRPTGLQSRLIDHRLTKGLRRNLLFNLCQTGLAGLEVDQMINSDKAAADTIHASYAQFSPKARRGMLNEGSILSDDERRVLRSRRELLPSLIGKVQRRVLAATAADFKAHGYDLRTIPVRDAVYSLQFRHAVALESLMIEWCASGGLETRSDLNIANDLIDASQVAFGTFFDGVMASDMRLLRVADLSRILIQALLRLCEAELDAPPNGSPATRLGKSGVREGPPSVS